MNRSALWAHCWLLSGGCFPHGDQLFIGKEDSPAAFVPGVKPWLSLREDMCIPEGEDFPLLPWVYGHLCRRLPLWLPGGFVGF